MSSRAAEFLAFGKIYVEVAPTIKYDDPTKQRARATIATPNSGFAANPEDEPVANKATARERMQIQAAHAGAAPRDLQEEVAGGSATPAAQAEFIENM
ncbi:hypothetical protein N0V95_003645 [Ascochyta clinopodiicola]|nr:hypothetical protein N0V95_003645 [Ascochyta clinopodiicola]